MYFKDNFYGYTLAEKFTLPTNPKDCANIIETLEFFLGLKKLMERSILPHKIELSSLSPLFIEKKPKLIPTVSYYSKY
ncbi:unnamed protein product [Cunninghamella blakesleeana]